MTNSGNVVDAIEQSIKAMIQPAAHVAAQETPPETKLETVEVHEKKIEYELSQYMIYAKKRCIDGFFYCFDSIKEIARTDEQINVVTLELNVKMAFSCFDSVAAANALSLKAQEGTPWRNLLGVTDLSVELLYRGAKRLIDTGLYPAAEAAFFFLTIIDYKQYPFWLGLGHAAFHFGNLYQAINAYEMAEHCEPDAYWPSIYMANSFEKVNDYHEALIALERAYSLYQNSTEKDPQLEHSLFERLTRIKAVCDSRP
jgi:tetratricopeptide (TPR) repeat protein